MTDNRSSANSASWIELIALLGALTLIVWLAFANPSGPAQHRNAGSAMLLTHASLLEKQLQNFHEKAAHYLENAPREYEHYFRDSVITHQHQQSDLELIDNSIEPLIEQASGGSNEPGSTGAQTTRVNGLPFARLRAEWKTFKDELVEQLGVDPDMPRLEWGSRHITEGLSPVIAEVSVIRERLQAAASGAMPATAKTPAWAWLALAAWLVLVVVWFGWRVRPRGK